MPPFDWRPHIEPHGADVANAAAISAAAIRELVASVREIELRIKTSTAFRADTLEAELAAAARKSSHGFGAENAEGHTGVN